MRRARVLSVSFCMCSSSSWSSFSLSWGLASPPDSSATTFERLTEFAAWSPPCSSSFYFLLISWACSAYLRWTFPLRYSFLWRLNMIDICSNSSFSMCPSLTFYLASYNRRASSKIIRLISNSSSLHVMKHFAFLSKCDQCSLKELRVCYVILRPSSFCDVLKLSRIIAMKRFKKMNETISMKLMKYAWAARGLPHSCRPYFLTL